MKMLHWNTMETIFVVSEDEHLGVVSVSLLQLQNTFSIVCDVVIHDTHLQHQTFTLTQTLHHLSLFLSFESNQTSSQAWGIEHWFCVLGGTASATLNKNKTQNCNIFTEDGSDTDIRAVMLMRKPYEETDIFYFDNEYDKEKCILKLLRSFVQQMILCVIPIFLFTHELLKYCLEKQ